MANYLYNGVELPVLPEWNKETHPHGIVGYSSNYGYMFSYSDTLWIADNNGEIRPPRFLTYKLSDDGTAWVSTGGVIDDITPIWTNTDIYNEDGTLYLAASDPIPVAAPALDPLSLFMGWKAGNWVARQRGKA